MRTSSNADLSLIDEFVIDGTKASVLCYPGLVVFDFLLEGLGASETEKWWSIFYK